MRRIAFLFALLLAAPAWADPPKAVIDGPTTRKDGQSIILNAEASVSDRPLVWEIATPAGTPLFISDKAPRKAVYAAIIDPEPGVYEVKLKAKGKVGDEWESDSDIIRIVVGDPDPAPPAPNPPTPPPGPSPPDPAPSPLSNYFGLTDVIRAIVPSVAQPAAARKAAALSLADAYRKQAARARDYADLGAANAAVRAANREALGADLEAWKPVLDAIARRLAECARVGRIATVVDLAAAQLEIADALRAEGVEDAK